MKEAVFKNSTNSIPRLNETRKIISNTAIIGNALTIDERYANTFVLSREERTNQQTYHKVDSGIRLQPSDVTFRAVSSPRKKIKAEILVPAVSTKKLDIMITGTDDCNEFSINYGKMSSQHENNGSNTTKTHRIDDSIFADAIGDADPALLMLKEKILVEKSSVHTLEGVTPHDEAAKTLIDFVSQVL